ncbi:hypothetical protein RJ640_014917 [Escallonia rubra]|uniref:Protein kinase domain-containing protein n=1 Tax=Escallonia rubra TaxID=112253 RepID=A0AA88RWD9_9ASTE|nr:hypothetical protein RJ640_014917 [Escallonia rubra]
MNHYHIFEAIGRGKYSTVYKGRKKKSIEYFALKSVDKPHKNKILQEDSKLPEDSVHELALDLVRALLLKSNYVADSVLCNGLMLRFLHSNGIIYCDLKPSNILLDENGRTKLCDFGLARKLSDISKTPSSQLPQAKRGTPCYMAPELFQDGGVHSFASDFWALGCVLYECYTGRPPFMGKEFTQLVRSILSDPTPPLPGTPSRAFANLINSLLVKDPAERIQWTEVCGHAFWRTKLTPLPLPPQPAFDNMIDLSSKPYLSERNGDKTPQNKTPNKSREKDFRGTPRQDENSILGSQGHGTPNKGVSTGRRTQSKASGRVVDEKQKDHLNNTRAVNLLRLSRIAKSNLQRENEKENYRRPLPNSSENDAEVKIENTDMELDFNENAEDDAQDEPDAADPSCTPEENLTPNEGVGKIEEMDIDTNQFDTPPVVDMPVSDDSRTLDQESSSEHVEVAASPPSSSPQLKIQRAKEVLGPTLDPDTSRSSPNLSQVLWHPSDLSVRPVMPSRKSDKGSESIPSLPFDAPPPAEYAKISKNQLDTLNSRIIGIFNGNTSSGEKQNVVRYLEMLSNNADAANILTNGPIMLVLVKMLRLSKALALRVQLASLLGLLIRHSTFIDDDLSNSGILNSLTDGLRDRQEKVRRFSMAALGELLFYISTQNEHKDYNPPESPSKDSRSSSGWQVSNSLISLVSSILRKGEDDLTQLYALRTIENISGQGGYWAARFNSQDVINNLCYIFRAPGKQESIRLTAGSCLVRLVRFSPPSIQQVIEKLSFKDTASALVKGSPREQQICLNLLNMAMLGSHMFTNIGRYLLPMVEDKNLVPNLLSLIEQGSEVLRGKALVFVALLCKNGKRWLPHFFCNARLLSTVDRLVKEKDSYVRQCLDAFFHVVASTVPPLLDAIYVDIQQVMGGRRHGQSAPTSRATTKSSIHLFPVVLHLLGSSSFKQRVVTPQVLQQLANLVKVAESPFQGRDDFQVNLLRVIESFTEEPSVIHESPNIFIREVLPSLSVLYKGNKDGDARFLCLKIWFDVMANFLYEPSGDEQQMEDLKSVSAQSFIPLYPTLMEDEDPIPMYAQKLFVMLVEFKLHHV